MNVYKVTASSLNVRDAATITGKVIGFFQKGDLVDFVRKSGDGYWFKVKTKTLEGWASHKYLELVLTTSNEKYDWMNVALAEAGVKEFTGNGDNPRVVEYLQSTNLTSPYNANDESPWCSAFVNWCMERSGFEGTDSTAARSWLTWGRPISTPERGCIVVFSRPPVSWQGHVGFFVSKTGSNIKVFGGNQSDEVNETNYPTNRLLGYRMPG